MRTALLLILLVSTTAHAQRRFEYSEVAMGVRARIVLYAKDEPAAQRAARAAYDRMAQLEDMMSDYRATSELSRLSAQSGGPPVEVSPELAFILGKSQELARRTDGAFDCTVGPLVKLWRKARKSGQLPPKDELDAALRLVGWRKLHIGSDSPTPSALSRPADGSEQSEAVVAVSRGGEDSTASRKSARLDTPGMQLDLGGIAKGYACDEAIRVLKQDGIKSALVEMGGDIAVSAAPPGRKGWDIGIANATDPKHKMVTLANAAVSSSGDTEQYVEIGGRRYSHVVDPRTGLGLTDRIAVTVVALNGVTSDGLSTAISVLGPTRGKTLAATYPGVTVYIRKGK